MNGARNYHTQKIEHIVEEENYTARKTQQQNTQAIEKMAYMNGQ